MNRFYPMPLTMVTQVLSKLDDRINTQQNLIGLMPGIERSGLRLAPVVTRFKPDVSVYCLLLKRMWRYWQKNLIKWQASSVNERNGIVFVFFPIAFHQAQ